MRIGIGIDTGGTYTDAVIYDFEKKSVLGSAKSLTTKDDLSRGILGALGLPGDLVGKARVVSLSSTLATNACVEDKGGNARLIFLGGDRKIVDRFGGEYGLPPAEEMHIQESYTNFSGEIEREPDWDLFRDSLDSRYGDCDGVGIVEMNAMKNGAVVEKKAKRLFGEKYDIPVVCGHELFSELNCLQRASSTLLNARLFPIIKEFLTAMKIAMEKRGIDADLVIVRSDGSLMSEDFTLVRPVETILCGPAASVIGAKRLSDHGNSIVIDMGGTTMDIALIREGAPVAAVDGVSIDKWKTFVDGLYVRTFGLGGDSAVHYRDGTLRLEEYRAVPLCIAAKAHPSIIENLRRTADDKRRHTRFLHEHYMLVRDVSDNPRYSDLERAFCRALRSGPMDLASAAAVVGKDVYTMDASRLLGERSVVMCGLTPTDIMHIRKDFEAYSAEASLLAAKFVALNLDATVDELCDLVYDAVKRRLYTNIIKVLLENKYPYYLKNGVGPDVLRLIDENYDIAKGGRKDRLLAMAFRTDYDLVGIGAPIKIFLDDVAEMLGARAVIPERFEVANALGAIGGNVYAACTIEIRQKGAGYTVYGNDGNRAFGLIGEAEAFAVSEAERGARAEAERRGAKGELAVSHSVKVQTAEARGGNVYLGTTVKAHAVGSLGF